MSITKPASIHLTVETQFIFAAVHPKPLQRRKPNRMINVAQARMARPHTPWPRRTSGPNRTADHSRSQSSKDKRQEGRESKQAR